MNPIQENVIFNAETDEFNKSLVDLRKELRHLRGVMTEVEQGTDEYNEALKRAADINTHITDLNREVKNSYVDLETGLGNVGKAAGSVVRSLNGLKGITNLVAGENSAASESIEKMMSMMALASGLSGISGMVTNFKNLNIQLKSSTVVTKGLTAVQRVYNQVLKANPIFIILGVIMAVVGGLSLLGRAIRKNTEDSKDNNKVLEEEKRLRYKIIDAMDFELAVRRELGLSREDDLRQQIADNNAKIEIHKQELQRLWSELRTFNYLQLFKRRAKKKEIEEEQKKLDELIKANELHQKSLDIIVEAGKRRRVQQRQDDAKVEEEETRQSLQNIRTLISEHYENLSYNSLTQQEKELEDMRGYYGTLIAEARKLGGDYEEIVLSLTEERNAKEKEINDRYAKLKEDRKAEEKRIMEKTLMTEKELKDRAFQEELNVLEEHYQKLVELAEGDEEELLRLKASYIEKKKEITNKDVEEEEDKKREIREAEIKHQMELLDATAGMLYGISELMSEHTIGYKALASATVVIDTIKGIMGIWSGVKDPIFSTSLATIQSTALGVMGAANLKKILSVNPTGENNPSKLANAGKPKMNKPNAPSFDNSINFIRQAQTEQEYYMQGQPVKAYVVETELRDVSQRVNQTESESSF